MRYLIPVLALSLQPITAHACEEGYAMVSMSFSGEVKSGETFKYNISPTYYLASGLLGDVKVPDKPLTPTYFILEPVAHGWHMVIRPDDNPTHNQNIADRDYIYPFNPPYRFNPLQYLDGSYGQETLKNNIRHFSFVVGLNDHEVEMLKSDMDEILWPKDDAAQEHGLYGINMFEKGEAVFKILDGTAIPAKPDDKEKTETVTRIKFHVDMKVPTYRTSCPARE